MKIRVIDFETTGSDKDRAAGKPAAICEVGFSDLTAEGVITQPFSVLAQPGHSMPPEARAIHHISDDDLVGAISPDTACAILMHDMQAGDAFAAHNAAFERTFFGGGAFPWICTMICAKHLYPDAPSFSNQALRYYLGVDGELEWPDEAMPPHRAGPDAYVTAHLLRQMTMGRTAAKLIELTTTPVLQKTVRFSKHSGQLWSEMDAGFLQWVLDPSRDFDAETKATARHWLNKRTYTGNPFGD